MKYIVLNENIVTEIIPEFDPVFPDVPVSERYAEDFVKKLVPVSDDTEVLVNWVYESDTNTFRNRDEIPQGLALDDAIAFKCSEINSACETAILAGFDYNGSHYGFSLTDQTNILSLSAMAQNGLDVPYHADGEECRIYSASEFMGVAQAAIAFKTHHTTYCNLLKMQVKAMINADDVYAVKYGDTKLNEEFAKRYDEIMSALAD